MEQPENPYYRRVHRPHQKLKMPLLGGLFSDKKPAPGRPPRDGGEELWEKDWVAKLIPLLVLGFIGYAIYDTFVAVSGKNKDILDGSAEIKAMTWDRAKVFKKYADITPNTRHYYLVIGKEGATKTIDFVNEKSEFWDKVDTFNHLTKAPGGVIVSIDAYDDTRDRVVEMKFDE